MKKLNSISLNEYYPSYALSGVGEGGTWLHICRLHHNFIFCVALILAFLVFSVLWMQRGVEGFLLLFVVGFCWLFFTLDTELIFAVLKGFLFIPVL